MSKFERIKESAIQYPEDILFALKETKDGFIKELKTLAAIKYYENKKLSLGKAAQLAELDNYDFIQLLGKNNVPVLDLSKEEITRDMENA